MTYADAAYQKGYSRGYASAVERDEALALLRELKEGASFFDSAIELFDLNGVEVKERIEALLSRKTDAPVSGV